MKKALFIFIFILFYTFAFSQSYHIGQSTIYENDKIKITDNSYVEDVWGDRRIYCKWRYPEITNKTNNEMEVKYNFTFYALDGKSMQSREKRINGETIIIQPHGTYIMWPRREFQKHSEFRSLEYFSLDSVLITNFELVHFRVIEKNYEIR